MNNSAFVSLISKWQDALQEAYRGARVIRFRKLSKRVCLACSALQLGRWPTSTVSQITHGVLPLRKAIVVGIDIREYSRRKPEQLLFLTMTLFASIQKVI